MYIVVSKLYKLLSYCESLLFVLDKPYYYCNFYLSVNRSASPS